MISKAWLGLFLLLPVSFLVADEPARGSWTELAPGVWHRNLDDGQVQVQASGRESLAQLVATLRSRSLTDDSNRDLILRLERHLALAPVALEPSICNPAFQLKTSASREEILAYASYYDENEACPPCEIIVSCSINRRCGAVNKSSSLSRSDFGTDLADRLLHYTSPDPSPHHDRGANVARASILCPAANWFVGNFSETEFTNPDSYCD
ncbi:MAG: hypothetical protein AAF604_03630 [Acidobacteriota bacterium]